MILKTFILVLSLSFFLSACSSKKDPSSYNNASMKHQQDKAKEAYKELN